MPSPNLAFRIEKAWRATQARPDYGVPAVSSDFVFEEPPLLDPFDPKFQNILRYEHGEFVGFHHYFYEVPEVAQLINDPNYNTRIAFSPSAVKAIVGLALKRDRQRRAE